MRNDWSHSNSFVKHSIHYTDQFQEAKNYKKALDHCCFSINY